MIAVVLFGIGEQSGTLAGRNMFPVLGRPLMLYPLLAAKHSRKTDVLAISTNSPAMAQIGANLGATVILRPAELSTPAVNMGSVFRHAVATIETQTGKRVEMLVVLLANAPAVTNDLIDRAVTFLQEHPDCDSVATVAVHNEFNPLHACYISSNQELISFFPPQFSRIIADSSRDKLGDVYFIDNCLRVTRRAALFSDAASSRLPYSWMGKRTVPIVHQGGFDVDYDWQIPGVERWLRQQGFTEDRIPYSEEPVQMHISIPAASGTAKRGQSTGRVLITTSPFGEIDPGPIELLERENIAYATNPVGRRLREEELAEIIEPYEVLIAGTEPITDAVLELAPNLRLIARVGIGLDNVPLASARERGIAVTYTPSAPSPAVAELTVGQMLALLRRTANADRGMRQGVWNRWIGRRLGLLTVGVIGVGRVGRLVIRHLQGWSPIRILAHDLNVDDEFAQWTGCVWTAPQTIFREADIITLHVPLTPETRHMISVRELEMMKPDAILINTARGGIVDEAALAAALRARPAFSAAIDVFEQEPYGGELAALENCLLSCHMGSGTRDCRLRMESDAAQEVVRYFRGEPFATPVPEAEYLIQVKG
jgi:D-3-phosphoglycerate dehydrogenase / 2-oxoglutarate reductase